MSVKLSKDPMGCIVLAGFAWLGLIFWGIDNGHDWICIGSAIIGIVACLVFSIFDFDGEED